ncbi:MAG TPA: helix-turn-helix domain-containing protein, partial [Chthonomonadales bacterium]|nr:helix-turn-helix domain-containing protein [Chthonomonadales bacterium]
MARKPALPGVDRRQQLLEAALEVFAEQGFEAATNKAIAERAGVNQGLIYFYFASKADVYFATFAHFTDQVMAQVDAVFAQEDDANAADDLARRLRQLLRILSSPPAIHLLRFIYQAISGRAPTGELSSNEGRKVVITLMRHLSQRL